MVLVGQIIYGYCEGYFGRGSYHDKRIEAVGADWIVARDIENGDPVFTSFVDQEEMVNCVSKWSKKLEDEDG